MAQQAREDAPASDEPLIKVKIYHDVHQREVSVPARATFGELKRILAEVTHLEPHEQRLLFRGVKRNDCEYLHVAGVKDMSKVVLLEDLASRERKNAEVKENETISSACVAVVNIRSEVDNLAEKVARLESQVNRGWKVEDKQFAVLTELLIVQLLKLDSVEADGEAKIQRKMEVRRVQGLMDTLDILKCRNSEQDGSSTVSVSTN